MGIDEYEAMQDTRKAAIRSAANLLESIDRARQVRKRIAALFPEPLEKGVASAKKKGDFLFDLVRLNARYLNQLSALGTEHSRIAHQALERLYSALVPVGRSYGGVDRGLPLSPLGEALVFTPETPATRTAKFKVERVDPSVDSVTVRWCPLSPTIRTAESWLVEIDGANVLAKDHADVGIKFDVTNVISVTVTDKLPIARRYTSEILVDMGAHRRRIPVVLDFRPKAKRDAS